MKKLVSLVIVLLLTLGTVGTVAYAESTEVLTYGTALKKLNILKGDATGNLNENKALTRGELVAIISTLTTPKMDTFKAPLTASFSDVPTTHWAYNHVERAKYDNITSGIGNGKFGVNDKVTYKESLAFMLNLLGYNKEWSEVSSAAMELNIFSAKAGKSGDLFTRGMMFEVLCRALTTISADGDWFINEVARDSHLNLTTEDVDYLWSAYLTLDVY